MRPADIAINQPDADHPVSFSVAGVQVWARTKEHARALLDEHTRSIDTNLLVGPFPPEPAPGSPEAVEQAADTIRGFTPGPWSVGGEWPSLVAVYDPNCVYIAHATTGEGGDWIGTNPIGRERAKANARLIAAAPDLLAERNRLQAEVEHLRLVLRTAEGNFAVVDEAAQRKGEQRDALLAEVETLRSSVSSWKVEEEDWKRRESELLAEVERLRERVTVDEARLRAFHLEVIAAGYPGAEPVRVGELREQRDALAAEVAALRELHLEAEQEVAEHRDAEITARQQRDALADALAGVRDDLASMGWVTEAVCAAMHAALRKAGR